MVNAWKEGNICFMLLDIAQGHAPTNPFCWALPRDVCPMLMGSAQGCAVSSPCCFVWLHL